MPTEPPPPSEPTSSESPEQKPLADSPLSASNQSTVPTPVRSADVPPANGDADAAPSARFQAWRRHRIKDGDTLSKLAQTYLGDPAREAEIFALNRDVLASPDVLPIGRW